MDLITVLMSIIAVCVLIVFWKKLPKKRDKILWATSVILLFVFILIDIFYPRTYYTFGGKTYTSVTANQIWLGIIIIVALLTTLISGFISMKKPQTTNRKIILIILIPTIIAIILFISDIFY